jgi:hypothetical protein
MSDITNSDDNSSTYKSPSLSSKRKNTPTQARRSSSATSSRIAANPRRESDVRGGISKRGGSQNNRNKSKGPSKTRKKKVDGALNIDTEGEMYDDNDISSSNLQHDDDSDEQQHALNLSKLNKKAQKQKRPIEHFSIIGGSDKVKCSLCERVSNLFFVSALKALSSA